MLVSGGLLVWASQFLGWGGQFFGMFIVIWSVLGVTLTFREPEATTRTEHITMGQILAVFGRSLTSRPAFWLMVAVCTYKLGEIMSDNMFKPFLLDAGYTKGQIAAWVSTWGMGASLLGSALGGWLAARVPLVRALGIAAAARVLPSAGLVLLSLVGPTEGRVIGLTLVEHFCGGALTTCMFALMMARVDRRIGATHYTALACLENWGKGVFGVASGVIAERLGYTGVFALAAGLSAAYLLVLVPLSRHDDQAGAGAAAAR
jgi:hypothetical protein